jgi:hypothetical protein
MYFLCDANVSSRSTGNVDSSISSNVRSSIDALMVVWVLQGSVIHVFQGPTSNVSTSESSKDTICLRTCLGHVIDPFWTSYLYSTAVLELLSGDNKTLFISMMTFLVVTTIVVQRRCVAFPGSERNGLKINIGWLVVR